jgi:hypothetical protein
MKHSLLVPLFLLPVLSTPGSEPDETVDRANERARQRLETKVVVLDDHSTWDKAWKINTKNFVVTTPMNYYIGAKLGSDLETMLGYFKDLAQSEWQAPDPMEIHLYPNLGAYNQFGDQFGEHHSSVLGSFYATQNADRPVATYFHVNRTMVSMWATHSAWHQFVDRAFARSLPTWIDEGLASYFGTFYWDGAYGVSEWKKIVESERFIPFVQLKTEGIDVYGVDPHTRFIELGMLFNYLLHYREDTRTQRTAEGVVLVSPAADWIALLLRGEDPSGHPVQELVSTRLDDIEREMKAYPF